MTKKAFVTGITGQDGSYLAELLLSKGYKVYGLVRRLSKPNMENISHFLDRIMLIKGDLHDQSSLNTAIRKIQPDEVYNLASQSFVGTSWAQPVLTGEVTGLGALRVFDAVKTECPDAKIYQAGSSEMFGKVDKFIQDETTPFHPRSPYGCAKAYAHYLAVNYRESYNMFICNGILFNHESPRRGIEFVTKKIAVGVARIASKLQNYPIQLGNVDTKRDWGYAPEYCEAMWLMLQQDKPDDYVIATGEVHSVKEFLIEAFHAAGIGISEEDGEWEKYVSVCISEHMRPVDINYLCGNYSKAYKKLGWKPKTKFNELVKIMVEYEINRIEKSPEEQSSNRESLIPIDIISK